MRLSITPKAGGGCSALGVLAFVGLAAGAIIAWPSYIDINGTRTAGVITEKRENVHIDYGEWFRHFEVIAAYSIPGQAFQHRAGCYVDQKTYDSLRPGSTVVVHYFANLLSQPFLPATHLSPCSTMASISLNPAVIRNLLGAAIALMAILFLWRVLHVRIAVWLLVPWFGLLVGYLVLPKTEPEPRHPVPATATIDSVTTITEVGDSAHSEGIRSSIHIRSWDSSLFHQEWIRL
jgi:hypothetical protein